MKYVGAGTVPSAGPTPGIENWRQYVIDRWGGQNLGTYVNRTIKGGDSLSVHAVGRAFDWGYPGRAEATEAIDFAIANFERLGIQAIHDYVECRIWRCSRSNSGPGWKVQERKGDMGNPSSRWLHFEVHPDSALHRMPVEGALDDALSDGKGERTEGETALPAPTLHKGDTGPGVRQLQEILAGLGYYPYRIDGRFGVLTEKGVMDWQRALQPFDAGPIDGWYGPKTHAAAASFAERRQTPAA